MNTASAAEQMLSDGIEHTAASLARKLDCTAKTATGYLYNIRHGQKYQTVESELPNRTVKVVSINGRKITKDKLWQLVLGPRHRRLIN